jgi:hypothetical protein
MKKFNIKEEAKPKESFVIKRINRSIFKNLIDVEDK